MLVEQPCVFPMDAADSSLATKDDVSSFRRPEEYNGDKDDQGRPHGEGIMKYHFENESYKGTWYHGEKVHGTFTMSDGSHYVGEFKDDEWHGLGLLVNEEEPEFWYEGEFKDGEFDGRGKQVYTDPRHPSLTYEGTFKRGEFVSGTMEETTGPNGDVVVRHV